MNFALILFILSVVTGVVWVYDRWKLSPQRRSTAEQALAQFDATSSGLENSARAQAREKLREDKIRRPAWVEYSGGFFPVIVTVFLLRSFLIEPFRIPSGSMVPTLLVGDLILVNKFTYGIRLPVINKKIIDINQPQRGDVMVFRYPVDEKFDYIKRVVGVPGDVIEYREKRLSVNGQAVALKELEPFFETERLVFTRQLVEKLGGAEHNILNNDQTGSAVEPWEFAMKERCSYDASGFRCSVPPGHYFMMGDNRDNSLDSRFWGFVPERNIVGKAFFIWLSLNGMVPSVSRIGPFH